MTGRYDRDPSPLKAGLVHAGLSAAVFTGIAAIIGTGIHFTGDAEAAGPRQVIALFQVNPDESPNLAGRIPDNLQTIAEVEEEEPLLDLSEFEDEALEIAAEIPATAIVAKRVVVEKPVEGIRINGKFVPNGKSLSQVTNEQQAEPEIKIQTATIETEAPVAPKPEAKTISADGLYERSATGSLPVVSKDGRTVFQAYARPFSNESGKPTVSVIIGGLGLKSNGRYTAAAINELPPEVTLSFVANAANLKSLVKQARAAGHEVIIEAPMEAYEKGRRRAHPNQLSSAASADKNLKNLAWALSRTEGYFAIMNYEGGKFASNAAAVQPVLKELARRGVGFVESGDLPGSTFAGEARKASLSFAQSGDVIDTQTDGTAIEQRLKELERRAMKDGQALATGFPYPVTIDTVKMWTERLEDKGLVLAPASTVFAKSNRRPVTSAQTRAATSDGAR